MASIPVVVPRIKLGSQGLEVSAQGLGCMGMTSFYGLAKPESNMIKLIHHAVDAGVTFLDTSDFYGPYRNEILIGKVHYFFYPYMYSFKLFLKNYMHNDIIDHR